MAAGQGDYQRVFAQYLLVNGRVFDVDAAEADIDASGFQGFDLLQGDHFLQAKLQLLITAQLANQLR
ncbi:hypothetical protein D3C79_1034600 [compost metagenome]